MRTLIVNGECNLAANGAVSLRDRAGFEVDGAFDGEEDLSMAQAGSCDSIVLELNLHRYLSLIQLVSGFELSS